MSTRDDAFADVPVADTAMPFDTRIPTMTTLSSDGEVAAPSNLQATANENGVDLSWQDNGVNEDGFIMKRKLADPNASFTDIATLGPNVTSYTDTQIQPNTTYVYRVRAFRTSGGGAHSNDATVTTLAAVAAPSNLQATASEGRVELTWQDNSFNEEGFKIRRMGPGETSFVDIATLGTNSTTYSDLTIQPNTTYTYRVRAFRNAGGGAASNDAIVTTLPLVTAPSNLQARATEAGVDLTWQDNSSNEDGFKVRRKGPTEVEFLDITTVAPNVTRYTDTQIQPNTTYTYRVRAFRNAGGGAASNDATVTTLPPVAAPTNLRATAHEGGVDLTWQDNSSNEDGFKVRRKGLGEVDFVDIATVGPNMTSYTDLQIQPNTTYTYRVRAFRNAGGGAASNDAMVTTLPLVAAPSNLQARATEAGVDLTWQDNSSNEDGFKIKRKGPNELDLLDIGTVGPNTTLYTDTTVQPNTTYVYRVRAFRTSGGGAASNDATVTTLPPVAAPSNLQAIAGEGRVELSWLDNATNEDGFKVKRKGLADVDFVDIATLVANTTRYSDTAVQPNTTYIYRVRAFRTSGGGAHSNDATVTTLAAVAAPSNLRATASEGRVDLTWQDNSVNEDGFTVRRKVGTDPNVPLSDIFTTGPNVTSYSDTAVQPNTTYTYRIRAFRNSGGGAISNDATVTTPSAADTTAPVVSAVTLSPAKSSYLPGEAVTITWTSADNVSVVAHDVLFSPSGEPPFTPIVSNLPGAQKSYPWTMPNQPTPNAAVRVVARDAAGNQGGKRSDPFAISSGNSIAPKVFSVIPAEGATTGGRSITVKGENFVKGASLFLGGVPAQNVRFIDTQTLSAETPTRDTAGIVNVRVVNPDTTEAVLPKSFTYNNPPTLREIAPNTGPIATDGTIVAVRGMFFQPGVQVFFKNASAKIRSVDAAGQEIVVEVPRSDTPGAVRVRVVNPDEGEARLPEGYTYLSVIQQQRARIRKVSPTAVLEQTPTVIDVYGNNLHDAYTNGTFAPRTATALDARPQKVELKRDPLTQEEIVSFTLAPRLTSGGKLGPLQRAIIEIIASRRKNAAKDGLVETFAMLTCLPQTTPVAVSFTASVNQGRTNALVVAGKNLQNTRLHMAQGKEWAGISLEHQFSDDNIALALVSVDNTTTIGTFSIELVDDSGSDQPPEQTLNLLPKSLEVTIQRPGNTPGAGNDGSLARLIIDDDDGQAGVDMSPLSAAPEQVALAPTKTDSIAYSLSAAPDAPPSFSNAPATFSGVPDTNSTNLIFGAKFDVLDLEFEFPLFAYARLVPIFNRGGTEVTDRGVVARLGTVTALRNQTLLLVLDVRLSIQIKVTVFIGVNPFNDIDSPQRFVDPFPTKVLPDNAFGVVVQVFVSTRVSIAASLFVGLLAPDPVTRALTVRQLAAIGFSVTLQGQGRKLDLDRRFVFNVKGLLKPKPLIFLDGGLELLGNKDDLRPDRFGLGFLAYYFARKKGKSCATFDYGTDDKDNTFELEFSSPTNETIIRPPLPNKFQVCVPVRSAAGYRIVRIEPETITVLPGVQQVVKAFGIPINEDGSDASGEEQPIPAAQVTFQPTDPIFRSDTSFDDAQGVYSVALVADEWVVTGLKEGGPRGLRAFATTKGPGNAVLPDKAIAFFRPSNNAEPRVALDTGLAQVNVAMVNNLGTLRIRGRIVIGDELGSTNTPETKTIMPDILTVHVSNLDGDKDEKGRPAVKFPLLDGNDPFDLSKTKSEINLKEKNTTNFDFRVVVERSDKGLGKVQLEGYLVITAKWAHPGKKGSTPQAVARVARLPLKLLEDVQDKEPFRTVILSPDNVEKYLWATVQVRDFNDRNLPEASRKRLAVDEGAFFTRIRNQTASTIHYRARFDIADDGMIGTVFGVPQDKVLLVRATNVRGAGQAYFDRAEYAMFTAAQGQRKAQITQTTELGSKALAPVSLSTLPQTKATFKDMVLVLDPGHGINYEFKEKRFYEWYLSYRICDEIRREWTKTLGGICYFVPTARFEVGTLHIGVNIVDAKGNLVKGVSDQSQGRQVLLTINRNNFSNDPTTHTFRWEARQIGTGPTRLTLELFGQFIGFDKNAERLNFPQRYRKLFDLLESRLKPKDLPKDFTLDPGKARYDADQGKYVAVITKPGEAPKTVELPSLEAGDHIFLDVTSRGALANHSIANSFKNEMGGNVNSFREVIGKDGKANATEPRADIVEYSRRVLMDGATEGRSLSPVPDKIKGDGRKLFIESISPTPVFALTVHLNAANLKKAPNGADGVDVLVPPNTAKSSVSGAIVKRILKYCDPLGNGLHDDGFDDSGSAFLANHPPLGPDRYAYVEVDYTNTPEKNARGKIRYGYMDSEEFVQRTARQLLAAIIECITPENAQNVTNFLEEMPEAPPEPIVEEPEIPSGPSPTITTFTPVRGPVGTVATISGSDFTDVAEVTINDFGVPFTVESNSVIKFTVVAGAETGPLFVTSAGGSAMTDTFFVVTPQPAASVVLSATPATQSVSAGQSINYSIAISRMNMPNPMEPVTLAVSGLPMGVTPTFSPNPATGTSARLTITTTASTPSGTSTLTISGTASGVTIAPITVSLTVSLPVSSVSLSASPTAQSITAGVNTGYNVMLNRKNFAGAVNLDVSGLPAGATAVFSDDPTTGTSAVLTITTTVGTPAGTSTLTISGTAPGVTIASIPISLTVTPAAGPPVITGFAPTSGPVGTRVSIAGAHFTGTLLVVFNGISASFTVDSPTSITATVPRSAASGPFSVTTAQGIATSPSSFLATASKQEIKEKDKELKEKELKEKESDGKNLRKDLKDTREGKDILESSFQAAGVSRSGAAEEPRSGSESAPGQLRHFIHTDWRPDLHAGTLKGEPDLRLSTPADLGLDVPSAADAE